MYHHFICFLPFFTLFFLELHLFRVDNGLKFSLKPLEADLAAGDLTLHHFGQHLRFLSPAFPHQCLDQQHFLKGIELVEVVDGAPVQTSVGVQQAPVHEGLGQLVLQVGSEHCPEEFRVMVLDVAVKFVAELLVQHFPLSLLGVAPPLAHPLLQPAALDLGEAYHVA